MQTRIDAKKPKITQLNSQWPKGVLELTMTLATFNRFFYHENTSAVVDMEHGGLAFLACQSATVKHAFHSRLFYWGSRLIFFFLLHSLVIFILSFK